LFVCMCGLSEKIRTTTTMREKSQPSERPFYYTVYLYFTTGSSWRGWTQKGLVMLGSIQEWLRLLTP